jgi:thioesterase domain-containing protein/acyl carrier protein
VVRKDQQGRPCLVAYLVGHEGRELNSKSLRAAAAAHLPRAMIPSRFVVMDRLPLTPGGKLDTRRLPDPGTEMVAEGRDHVAPRTDVERVIAGQFAQLLGQSRVGRYDDFFELGGSSLQAAQVSFRLQQAFGVEVLLRDLFQASSVVELAKIVDRGRAGSRAAGEPDSLVCLNEREGSPLFLVHPVSGAAFCYAGLARCLDRPLYAFQALGLESDHAPLTSVPELATRYVAALRAHCPPGGRVIGGWSVGGLVAMEMARQLQSLGEPVERLLLIDAPTPFTEPLVLSDAEVALEFARDVAAMAGENLPAGAVLHGSMDDMADALLAAGLVQNVTEPEVLRRRLRVYRATLEAALSHTGDADPYPGAVAILSPDASAGTTRSWRERLRGPVTERLVPGDHYTMFHGANLAVLARHVLECLNDRERP